MFLHNFNADIQKAVEISYVFTGMTFQNLKNQTSRMVIKRQPKTTVATQITVKDHGVM